jgi:hypothetical protein
MLWEALKGRYMDASGAGSDVTPPEVREPPPADPETELILKAADRAVYAAIREHKLLGFPIVVWDEEQQRSKIVAPEDIRLEDYGDGT